MVYRLVPLGFGLAAAVLAPQAYSQGTIPFDLNELTVDPLAPEFAGIDFTFHPVGFEASEAAGVAVMDFDNDSLLDIYLPNSEFYSNKLYRNLGNGKIVDVAVALGVAQPLQRRAGALFIDVENDGDLDLLTLGYPGYTANMDLYTLFRNDGAPAYSFTDVTVSAGSFPLAPTEELTFLGDYGGASAGDFDGDGYVDFMATYWARLPGYLYDQMRIWRSVPNSPGQVGATDWSARQFQDVTISTGLDQWLSGSTWMPSLIDYNRDGHLDVHINVDFGMDILRLNDGDGVFKTNASTAVGLNGDPAESRNEMGIAFGDVDFDGDLDQFQSNAYFGDRFYRNDSVLGSVGTGLLFTDFAPAVNADQARFGWGVALADMDNDADLDLLRVAGFRQPQSNFYHENQWPATLSDGVTPLFVERSDQVPAFAKTNGNLLDDEDIARSLVPFDMDNDGDLDLVVTRSGISPFIIPGKHTRTAIYENTLSSPNGWVEVDLLETGGSRNVVGAKVYVRSAGVTQYKQVIAGSSYLGQMPDRQHFGLGDPGNIGWILVRWTDNTVTGVLGTPPNSVATIQHQGFDFLGDVYPNGVVDAFDLVAFDWVVANPVLAEATFGKLPYKILGDLNGDNVLDNRDRTLLEQLITP
ncbi:MAG: hypothetical protein ACI9C2_000134 [Gammaproteobacteria bacterium]|jgi:hypothetical protein